jgi:predicted Holliday junction resolvase-like endonuclease
VRTLLHPVDYVAFEGMNSSGGVRMVSLLYIGGRNDQIRTIEEAVAKRSFGWNTIRLSDEGGIEESKGGSG